MISQMIKIHINRKILRFAKLRKQTKITNPQIKDFKLFFQHKKKFKILQFKKKPKNFKKKKKQKS